MVLQVLVWEQCRGGRDIVVPGSWSLSCSMSLIPSSPSTAIGSISAPKNHWTGMELEENSITALGIQEHRAKVGSAATAPFCYITISIFLLGCPKWSSLVWYYQASFNQITVQARINLQRMPVVAGCESTDPKKAIAGRCSQLRAPLKTTKRQTYIFFNLWKKKTTTTYF